MWICNNIVLPPSIEIEIEKPQRAAAAATTTKQSIRSKSLDKLKWNQRIPQKSLQFIPLLILLNRHVRFGYDTHEFLARILQACGWAMLRYCLFFALSMTLYELFDANYLRTCKIGTFFVPGVSRENSLGSLVRVCVCALEQWHITGIDNKAVWDFFGWPYGQKKKLMPEQWTHFHNVKGIIQMSSTHGDRAISSECVCMCVRMFHFFFFSFSLSSVCMPTEWSFEMFFEDKHLSHQMPSKAIK